MKTLWSLIGLISMLLAPLMARADETRLALATRWYTDVEVQQGGAVFQAHCAALAYVQGLWPESVYGDWQAAQRPGHDHH